MSVSEVLWLTIALVGLFMLWWLADPGYQDDGS